jgi:hypothetical protein
MTGAKGCYGMLHRKWLIALISLTALAGCRQQSQQVLPTLIPTLSGQTQATPVGLPTTTAQPTQLPTAVPVQRPTLPPTWTPSPAPTQTPDLVTPTENVISATQAQLAQATLPACANFREDRDRFQSTFRLGTSPQVVWTPADNAISYRVSVIDDTGRELFSDLTKDTQYSFRADLFERGKVYGWQVYPIDPLGQQMCLPRGSELYPQG